MTSGLLAGESPNVTVESEGMVAFADGIETDHLTLSWGQLLAVSAASRALIFVQAEG